MRNNFSFNPKWNFKDDIEFHTEVKLMDRAFFDWPSLEITKMMEAKMPPQLVADMKEEAARRMSNDCAPEEYICEVLRLPEDYFYPGEIPEEEIPDFPEKESRRASRRKAEIKARRRKAEIAKIQKSRRMKQDKDGEIWYLVPAGSNRMYGIHDSELWKPLDKRHREIVAD